MNQHTNSGTTEDGRTVIVFLAIAMGLFSMDLAKSKGAKGDIVNGRHCASIPKGLMHSPMGLVSRSWLSGKRQKGSLDKWSGVCVPILIQNE